MQQPCLRIFAGCNGSGKSTYSHLLSKDAIPFDYDKRFLERYTTMPDSELREEIAKNITSEEFLSEFNNALINKVSFAFETNLFPYPENFVLEAKKHGFRLEMYFFCLNTIELAKERVEIRVKNNGHDVDHKTIEFKWREGYKNINLKFCDFDYLVFIDNSLEQVPTFMFEMEQTSVGAFNLTKNIEHLPEYTERRLPAIFNLIHSK